jgi:MSHA biogenesis protein MshM
VALYLAHFGLHEPPFRITPHTDFFFDGADRGATLEALIYAIVHDEGIVKLSGEVGSGKTMLCRVLMERLPPHVATIYLATPALARDEILAAIGDELGLKLSQQRMTVALRELQEHLIGLYAAGRRVVILLDEAHVMPDETLEQVRLLSNLESNRHKLLQIVLFGQPELDAALAKPSLRQLRDRITQGFRMRPLPAPEVGKYISFRLRAAGYRGPDLFSAAAIARIARASDGLTRRINILADKALLAAFTENAHGITERYVRAAIADAEFVTLRGAPNTKAYLVGAVATGVAIGIAIHWALWQEQERPRAPVAAPAQEAVKPEAQAPAPPVAALREEQLRRFLAYSSGRQRLLGERMAATREALERAPNETYALELFVTGNSDPARMERFLARARELVPLERVFVIPMSGGARLRVVLGQYTSLDEALNAARMLPPRYQQAFRALPRSFAQLREEI